MCDEAALGSTMMMTTSDSSCESHYCRDRTRQAFCSLVWNWACFVAARAPSDSLQRGGAPGVMGLWLIVAPDIQPKVQDLGSKDWLWMLFFQILYLKYK